MCIVCIEIQKERMTFIELNNAIRELYNSTQDLDKQSHYLELIVALREDNEKRGKQDERDQVPDGEI